MYTTLKSCLEIGQNAANYAIQVFKLLEAGCDSSWTLYGLSMNRDIVEALINELDNEFIKRIPKGHAMKKSVKEISVHFEDLLDHIDLAYIRHYSPDLRLK